MIDAKSILKHMHILQSFCIAVFLSLFRHNKTPKVFCPTFGVHVILSNDTTLLGSFEGAQISNYKFIASKIEF